MDVNGKIVWHWQVHTRWKPLAWNVLTHCLPFPRYLGRPLVVGRMPFPRYLGLRTKKKNVENQNFFFFFFFFLEKSYSKRRYGAVNISVSIHLYCSLLFQNSISHEISIFSKNEIFFGNFLFWNANNSGPGGPNDTGSLPMNYK